MDTPPPACSSLDLTGQGERGLRGSAGLGAAPCCADNIPAKKPTSYTALSGGHQDLGHRYYYWLVPRAGLLGPNLCLNSISPTWGDHLRLRAAIRRTRVSGSRPPSGCCRLSSRRSTNWRGLLLPSPLGHGVAVNRGSTHGRGRSVD